MNSKPENNIGNIRNRERRIEISTIINTSMKINTYIQIEGVCYFKRGNQIENPKKMYDEGMNGFKRREIDAEMRCG